MTKIRLNKEEQFLKNFIKEKLGMSESEFMNTSPEDIYKMLYDKGLSERMN